MKNYLFLAILLGGTVVAAEPFQSTSFQPGDVFELEWASDPQLSPDGKQIVYVRNFMDIMSDLRRSNLWSINADGTGHRPLTTGSRNDSAPRWSPDGKRLLYVSRAENGRQLFMRWMDSGETARLTQLTEKPANAAWSPNGKFIVFSALVPDEGANPASMPAKPEDAEWAEPVKVIDQLVYRRDGEGFLKPGRTQLFVLPAEGGTPRQVTDNDHDHGAFFFGPDPVWGPDSRFLYFAANRHADWEYDPLNTEIYALDMDSGELTALTDRHGPDHHPVPSPDGKRIAWLGFDDRYQGYQVEDLYVMDSDGNDKRALTADFDRQPEDPVWSRDGRGLFFRFDDEGHTKLGYVDLNGRVTEVTDTLGGTSIGRPYSSGSFSTGGRDLIAFTHASAQRPADVAVISRGGSPKVLTRLNEDLLAHRNLGEVETIWYDSSYDERRIQGWIIKPPDFEENRKYPLILEIHGGPFAMYGEYFSPELQLYAAADYVVLYTNPRGSTGYGEEFGNLIHHDYPNHDFDDLMSGVDAMVERGFVDPERLFVTGGSGGGVLSAWIVGHTDRFRGAAVQKPVINWYSFVLTSDFYNFFYRYWFPGPPWEHMEHYMQRSPLSYVGNVTTPTMLITGEADYRTPMSETEQFYQALKLRDVDAALVRIPGAPHDIAGRPSNLIAKVLNILDWFERHDIGN